VALYVCEKSTTSQCCWTVTIFYGSADLDPDPNLYFDADPEPEPDQHQKNDADPHVDLTPHMLENQIFFTFSHTHVSLQCFTFLISVKDVLILSTYFGAAYWKFLEKR
jgi:hypothetical protein